MKKLMKNRLFHVVVPFLMLMLVLVSSNVSVKAATSEIATLEASVSDKTVTVKGTTDSSKTVYAVAIAVYDSEEVLQTIYSTDVTEHKFSASFTLANGTYLIKVANYEGGEFKETSVTVKDAEKTPDTKPEEEKTIAATGDGNVVLKDASGIIPEGAKMKSTKLESGEVFTKATELMKKLDAVKNNANAKTAVFEFDLTDKNGVAIHELGGKVSVTLDAPFEVKSGFTIKAYRLDGDKLVACETTYKDGKVTFTTDHFSTYVFVEEKVAAATGDFTSLPWISFVGLLAGMGLVMLGIRGRRVNE